MRPLEIDRSTWIALVSVGILTIVGIAATVLTSSGSPAADASTPLGVVTAYVRAIQAGDADRAWALTGQSGVPATPAGPLGPSPRDTFGQQLQSSRQPTSPRVRIVTESQSGQTATVELEVSHASGNPLTGVSSQPVTVSLTRQAEGWRITDPFPWEFQ